MILQRNIKGEKKLNKKKNGFTLIEVMILTVIIAILFSIAIPACHQITSGKHSSSNDYSTHRVVEETKQNPTYEIHCSKCGKLLGNCDTEIKFNPVCFECLNQNNKSEEPQ